MRWSQLYARTPICSADSFAGWTWYVDAFQGGAFAVTFVMHMSTLCSSTCYKAIYDLTLTIGTVSFLACCSSLMTLSVNWGGVCVDMFGLAKYYI